MKIYAGTSNPKLASKIYQELSAVLDIPDNSFKSLKIERFSVNIFISPVEIIHSLVKELPHIFYAADYGLVRIKCII